MAGGDVAPQRDLKADFEAIWDTFVTSTQQVADALGSAAARHEPVHGLLASLYAVPYWKAKGLVLGGAATRLNPEPLSGLFFERFACSVFVEFLCTHHPDAQFYVGRGSEEYAMRVNLPRDPDLCVQRGSRTLIVEFKTSPKKRDLDYVETLHTRYAAEGMLYLFCGGEVVAQRAQIARIVEGGWAAFLEARRRNAAGVQGATVDRLLHRAAEWLGGA